MFSNQSFKTALNHASRIAVQRRDDGLLLGTDSSLPVDTRFVRENTFTPRNASFNIRHFLSNKKNRPPSIDHLSNITLSNEDNALSIPLTLLSSLLRSFHPFLTLSFVLPFVIIASRTVSFSPERERERESLYGENFSWKSDIITFEDK